MEYFIKKLNSVIESKSDIGMPIYAGNGMTVECYNLKKNTTLLVNDELEHYYQGDQRTICYICVTGELEVWIKDEKAHLTPGTSITIFPDGNFSLWAKEASFIYAIHNKVEPDVDNTPKQLVESVNNVELRDVYLQGHNYRVGKYSTLIMQIINPKRATTSFHIAAAYHDVGKMVVDEKILNKNGKLTEEEFEQIKKHPIASYELLREYLGDTVAGYARSHHEKLDGSGYPDGLKGEEISLESRIMAVADIFDALTTSRCYRTAFSFEKAFEIMDKDAQNNKIDKDVLEVLKNLVKEGKIIDGVDNFIEIKKRGQ